MIKWDLLQGCKNGSTSPNQSMWYTTLQNESKKFKIISIDKEKGFDKVQHLSIIKTLNKVSIDWMYFNIVKARYDYPTDNTYSMVKIVPEQDKNVHSHHFYPSLLKVLVRATGQEKEKKRHPNWKGISKTVIIFRWQKILSCQIISDIIIMPW